MAARVRTPATAETPTSESTVPGRTLATRRYASYTGTPATARSLARAAAESRLLAVEGASSCSVVPKIRDANNSKCADP
jgi:hypothetical protein